MRRILSLVLCVFFLSGCALSSEERHTPTHDSVVLATTQPEKTILPIVVEFENRTGIWVDVRTGNAGKIIELACSGECDLVLGPGADTMEANREIFRGLSVDAELASWVPTGSNWVSVFASRPVIIYNRNLVQNNPPERFDDLLSPMWSGQIALGDPEQCDVAAMTVTILGGENQSEMELRLEKLCNNVVTLLPQTRDAVDEVAKGNACLALVTSEMLAGRPVGSLGKVEPKGDTLIFAQAAGIPVEAKHPEEAEELLSYFLTPEVQAYASTPNDCISVLDALEYENFTVFDSRHAGQYRWAVREAWLNVWEGGQ